MKKSTLSKSFNKNIKMVPYQETLTRVEKGAMSRIYTKYFMKKPYQKSIKRCLINEPNQASKQ